MKIGTALFTYCRYEHTKKTIESLRDNTLNPLKLYVFQDGLKTNGNYDEWAKVNKLIKEIDFCPTELIISTENRGLALSLVDGIDYVLRENDAVIVLEDDCVTAPRFMRYMYEALDYYIDNKEVYSVDGYRIPADYDCVDDAFFLYRFWSWGWATWKDRWIQCRFDDTEVINRMEADRELSLRLALCGNDLRQMYYDRLNNKNDSWAIFWTLLIIEKGGVCLSPKKSMISNIGNDGTGVHCGITDSYDVELEKNTGENGFAFPKSTSVSDRNKKVFLEGSGGWTAVNNDIEKEHIAIYGMGKFFFVNEKWLNQRYYIDEFIDANRCGYYAGKEIKNLETYERNQKILISLIDMEESMRVKTELIKRGSDAKNIYILTIDNDSPIFGRQTK